jgi:hypothetical protein
MDTRKIITGLFSIFVVTSFLLSQSLVEFAKKEQERRARLKGKKGIVVTNADLFKILRREAVAIISPETEEEEQSQEAESAPEQPTQEEEPGIEQVSEEERERNFRDQKGAFEAKANSAKRMVDLLTTKMNSLWVDFYDFDTITPKDRIEAEISETYLNILKAQAEETKAKEELDQFLAQARKEGIPIGWFRNP